MAEVRSSEKKTSIDKNAHHAEALMWSGVYEQDMKYVLFTDETGATLDGPDGGFKGWLGIGAKLHNRFRRNQGGGGVMLWAGILDNQLIGPVMVLAGVKINSRCLL